VGTDDTMAWTVDDGWVWVFDRVDHHTAEAWAQVAKVGDRFAALQPVYDAVPDRFGALAADTARDIDVRHDWGSQYRSHHFTGSLAWLGFTDSPGYPRRARMQRARRTVDHDAEGAVPVGPQLRNIDDLRQAVAAFVELYNTHWLIERLGHRTPRETYHQ
jgi:putative transposase